MELTQRRWYGPPTAIPEALDGLVMDARMLLPNYRAGDVKEDAAFEWLADYAQRAAVALARHGDPLGHLLPYVELAIEQGRTGDQKADAAVDESASSLIGAAESLRTLLLECWQWVRAQLKKQGRPALDTPGAA